VCEKKYHAGGESEQMFKDAGIELIYFIEEIEKYDNQ
jgi:dCMP deaminase